MADPAFRALSAFWPYLDSPGFGIRSIPESADVNKSEKTNTGSANPTNSEQPVSNPVYRRSIPSDENTLDHLDDDDCT